MEFSIGSQEQELPPLWSGAINSVMSHARMHPHMHACTHPHMHTHTHTFMHTHTSFPYNEDITQTTTSCSLGTCDCRKTSYSKSEMYGGLRLSHLWWGGRLGCLITVQYSILEQPLSAHASHVRHEHSMVALGYKHSVITYMAFFLNTSHIK